MIQFHSYRKRLLWRYGSQGLKNAAFAVGILFVYALAAASFRESAPVEPVSTQTAYVAPQPNVIPAATRQVAVTGEVSGKPSAPAPHAQSLAEQISSNISDILEPGSRALTSAKKVVVGRGDTLMDVLVTKASVPKDDAYEAVMALSKVYNPRDLKTGHEITVFFHKDPAVADPKFSGVRIEKDIVNTVTVKKDEDSGSFTANNEEKDVQRNLKAYKGKIDNSLYVDAKAAGVPDAVILELIKMYSWNVDFQREIQAGDKFEVMFEEYKTEDGKTVRGRGNVLYAKLTLSGDEMPFYRYEDKTGDTDYYDNGGQSAKRPLMKTPIDGARLSSGYGMRKHPVLGYTKMHKGVDFAAPRGTPIYAAGDGVIEKIGPFSSFGKYIRVRHRNDLKTAYAHMKSFKAGLKSGSRVKQGDIIGYVGTTGRSTGPHLHYEVLLKGTSVNPKSVKLPLGKSLRGKEVKTFKTFVARTQQKFQEVSLATRLNTTVAAVFK